MIIGTWSPSPHGLENQSVNERGYQVEHFDHNILILMLGSTQKFRRVDWTINLSLIAKFLVLGSIGDHWS